MSEYVLRLSHRGHRGIELRLRAGLLHVDVPQSAEPPLTLVLPGPHRHRRAGRIPPAPASRCLTGPHGTEAPERRRRPLLCGLRPGAECGRHRPPGRTGGP
ncbi:hypothetical protein [Streptomyces sp. NBC_01808]|uniref:hypothetical protein n=1 Tax=Streptomyces sp. NBC_01808 TaxID=2975947 RepID=UPI002DDC8EAB|nr:hypothetical protein [Streptomyces sp. NBC_01808]